MGRININLGKLLRAAWFDKNLPINLRQRPKLLLTLTKEIRRELRSFAIESQTAE